MCAMQGNFALLYKLFREGGFTSIFAGLHLELLRGILSGALMLSMKEALTLSVKIFLFHRFGYLDQVSLQMSHFLSCASLDHIHGAPCTIHHTYNPHACTHSAAPLPRADTELHMYGGQANALRALR